MPQSFQTEVRYVRSLFNFPFALCYGDKNRYNNQLSLAVEFVYQANKNELVERVKELRGKRDGEEGNECRRGTRGCPDGQYTLTSGTPTGG
jgi:hypothetical protein